MNSGKRKFVGECLDMCPSKEAEQHGKYELSEFEIDKNTHHFRKDLAITTFHRSEANRKFTAPEIRPLHVLQKTMRHILKYVIGERLNTSEKTKEIDLFMYLRDRFRSMCTDIYVQQLEGEEVIELYQTMVLFFIWSGARFPNNYDTDTFDNYMNLQLLTDLFDKLNEQYKKIFEKTQIHYPYEADFKSFNLLIYISNEVGQFMAQVYNIVPPDLLESEPIKNVFKLRQAVISQNIPQFLKIINFTPIQFSIMALQNVPYLYYNTFLSTRKAFRTFKFDKDFFTTYLDLPNNFFDKFAKCFSIKPDDKSQNGDIYSFELNTHPDSKNSPPLPLSLDIQQRFFQSPLLEFLKLKPSSPIIIPPVSVVSEARVSSENEAQINPETEDNFESNQLIQVEPEHISSQPSMHITPQPSITDEMEKPGISPQFSDFKKIEIPCENEETENENEPIQPSINEFELPPARLSRLVSQEFQINNESEEDEEKPIHNLLNIKMTKIFSKPKLFDFISMIPPNLPPFCFISVLVNDSDDSPSAKFAYNCFNSLKTSNNQNNIIYLGNSKIFSTICQRSHVYMSIVRKQYQKYMNSVGSILNCEDTTNYETEDDDVPIFTFSLEDSKCSPDIILNSLMRKCIESAVIEFQPINLTDIVKDALELSMKIALSPKWQRSSCNSVLCLINKVNDSLANIFESELFMRYLLPFIHNQFGPDKMKQFASSVRKMKIPLIEKEESIKPRPESSWPLFIRDNLKIKSMTPFIAPVSEKFNRQGLLEVVVGPFENSYPTEYVIQQQEEEISFTSILHAFDCELYE